MSRVQSPPEDIGARKPVDRTAALVTGRGVHYEPNKTPGSALSDMPFATIPLPAGVPDLAGRKFGRFTVVGFCGITRKTTSGGWKSRTYHWSVRCSCGWYSIRSHKAIYNPRNTTDACERCRHVIFLKRRQLYDAGLLIEEQTK